MRLMMSYVIGIQAKMLTKLKLSWRIEIFQAEVSKPRLRTICVVTLLTALKKIHLQTNGKRMLHQIDVWYVPLNGECEHRESKVRTSFEEYMCD